MNPIDTCIIVSYLFWIYDLKKHNAHILNILIVNSNSRRDIDRWMQESAARMYEG
jgi:hypothetical protein